MGFSSAVQWWEEEQLRCLVLASLFLQYLLLLTARMRKFRGFPGLKFLTWLTYLASDSVAVYALAALFNRHRKQQWVSMHRDDARLEALWAPILLLHLGGQDTITAYNIEDNELWSRRFLTAVSQITVAIYVIRKSWSDDRLFKKTIFLILVPGVLKCMEKPIALRSASINSVASRRERLRRARSQFSGHSSTRADSEDVGMVATPSSLTDYVKEALKLFGADTSDRGTEENEPSFYKSKLRCKYERMFGPTPYRLFVDLAYPYSNRLKNLRYMVDRKDEAHSLIRCGLSRAFDRFYTKAEFTFANFSLETGSGKTLLGMLLRFLVINLTFTAGFSFQNSNGEAYNAIDVMITKSMIFCTAALEYLSLLLLMQLAFPSLWVCTKHRWPDQVAQYNLIGYLARNNKCHYQWLRRFLLIGKDCVDQRWCMKPCKSSNSITALVYDHVVDGWDNCIRDTATYRKFNDNRGQRTLQREQCEGSLNWSVQRPFDESVILWHLATDFCFHNKGTTRSPSLEEGTAMSVSLDEVSQHCREMSNYMAYLLFVKPDMLIPGARRSLFKDAYGELKKMVTDNQSLPLSEEGLTQKIIEKRMEDMKDSVLVHKARVLFDELKQLAEGPEGWMKTWRVIQGVWVEMLCFSAGRCRGYLHAKSLGNGGEYLSYVWLLWWYMGMETVAEKMQRTELDPQGDIGGFKATSPTSAPSETTMGDSSV